MRMIGIPGKTITESGGNSQGKYAGVSGVFAEHRCS
jgi:hypothetical protein